MENSGSIQIEKAVAVIYTQSQAASSAYKYEQTRRSQRRCGWRI